MKRLNARAALAFALVILPPWQVTSAAPLPNATFNVQTYGAVGDNSADDTAEIQAAIDAAQAVNGTVVIPSTVNGYKISSTLHVTAPVRIVGEGGATPNWGDFTGGCAGAGCFNPAQSRGPRLVWAGGTSPMLTITNAFGVIVEYLVLDGVGVATTVLQLDRVRHARFSHVAAIRAATLALAVGSTSAASGAMTADGSFENAFYSCFWHGPKGVVIDKLGSGITGGYHNRFYNNIIHFTGSTSDNEGLRINSGDNNTFFELRTQNVSGTSDRAVVLGPSTTTAGGSTLDPLKAYNNRFYGLQAQGVYVENDGLYAGVIFGLDMANWAAIPNVGTNAKLTWTSDGYNQATGGLSLWKVEGALITRGGRSESLAVISGTTTLNPSLYQNVAVTGTFNLTIPSAATYSGYVVNLTNYGGGTVTLQRSGSDLFYGRGASSASAFALPAGTSVKIQSDGAGAWFLF